MKIPKQNVVIQKKLTCKGTLRQVFIRVYRYRYTISHVGIFDSALWTIAPLTFSLVHLPFPLLVWLWGGGGGCWVLLETIFCRSLTLCLWPDSELAKLLDHPKQKPSRGLRQINTCRIAFYRSNISSFQALADIPTLSAVHHPLAGVGAVLRHCGLVYCSSPRWT